MKRVNVGLLFQMLFLVISFKANAANYYVNDADNTGDRWCSAIGDDANDGTTIATPKLTLSDILDDYDLGAGDIVYIDHGTYSWASIDWSNAIYENDDLGTGTGANVLTIQGAGVGGTWTTDITCSSNDLFYIPSDSYDYITFDGLKLTAATTKDIFHLIQPDYITISNCTMIATGLGSSAIYSFNAVTNLTVQLNEIQVTSSATIGIEFGQGSVASDIIIERNHIDGVNGSEATYGIYDDQGASNFTCRNNFISNFLQGVYRDQDRAGAVFYNNSFYCKNYCIQLGAATVSTLLKNNIFYCYGAGAGDYPLFLNSTSNVTATGIDYNLYHTAGSNYVRWNNTDYATLAAWQGVTNSPDANSVTGDPGYSTPTSCDLSIGSGSPAADEGVDGLVSNDITTAGTRANPPEIGAFEVGSLPITLLSFDANCNNNLLEFNWATASEINNDFFTVERSKDNKNWETAFTIKGAGNSNQILHYSGTEENQLSGISYYRLKQTDFDGQYDYSEIISSLNCSDKNAEISIFPNPSEGRFNIVFSGNKEDVTSVGITNSLGQIVFNSNRFVHNIDLSEASAGTYILHLNLKNSTIFKKIEVIK